MLLTLQNIGKIENAEIYLNGITVIAGENNTGKSTIGKVLFSVFNSFYRIESQIEKERMESIRNILHIPYSKNFMLDAKVNDDEYIKHFVSYFKDSSLKNETLKNEVQKIINLYELNNSEKKEIQRTDLIKKIMQVITVSEDEILKTILYGKLFVEFEGQINNIYTKKAGTIQLKIKDTTVAISVEDDRVVSISDKLSLNTQAIYIDDPFVLDNVSSNYWRLRVESRMTHRNHLVSMLSEQNQNGTVIEEIIASKKLDKIFSSLNNICGGDIVRGKGLSSGYGKAGSDKLLNLKNLSTGLKTFVILKTLLKNGYLEENGTIVLDEPEIHLHPEWQLLFAELIVLLQKEFNMHVLLTTHSPYFLNAIEVYSAKHKIADKCRYYLTSMDNDIVKIDDVSKNIELIYKKLARPFQDLENERYGND